MKKLYHEIRDPIHMFVRLKDDERKVLDSEPIQRLRYIHQLGLTYLLYPGATHKRFEHSLGVMELASRVFDVVTNPVEKTDEIKDVLPEVTDRVALSYWRQVVRMAALCHDIGHLPFSHSAEEQLLPEGWDHERITFDVISKELGSIWGKFIPPLKPELVAKIAVGPKKAKHLEFTLWETILSEIITGDAFGVDRIDYLLRDSLHVGVAYGKFDHYRLIDTLKILISRSDNEPTIGIESGGLHGAEALLLARYFMFMQVYYHRIRCIYDKHLEDFLKAWLPKGKFPTGFKKLKKYTDNFILNALTDHKYSKEPILNELADRIVNRRHFKMVYELNPVDFEKNNYASQLINKALCSEFDKGMVRYVRIPGKGGDVSFPVEESDGQVVTSLKKSQVLGKLPVTKVEFVYVHPDIEDKAKSWLSVNREDILKA